MTGLRLSATVYLSREMVPKAKTKESKMIKIKMEVVKTLERGRTVKGAAEAVVDSTLMQAANDLCGSVACRRDENGEKEWSGSASCAAYIDEEASDAAAFIEKHGLAEFATLLVEKRFAGSFAKGDWRIDYRFFWKEC